MDPLGGQFGGSLAVGIGRATQDGDALTWWSSKNAVFVVILLILGCGICCCCLACCAVCCFVDGQFHSVSERKERKSSSTKPGAERKRKFKPPTLWNYWLHEHALLAILWSQPMYYDKSYYLTRFRRVLILLSQFLMAFIVTSGWTILTEPFPDCPQSIAAYDQCQLEVDLGASCEGVANDFLVGFNDNLIQYVYHDTGTAAHAALLEQAMNTTREESETRPCWRYCINGTDYTPGLVIEVKDGRQNCSNVVEDLRTSLVCYTPFYSGQWVCDSSIFFSISPLWFFIRALVTVSITLPASFLFKKTLRCTALSKGCEGACKRIMGYPIIVIMFVICIVLSVWMAAELQNGELVGDFTISFLGSFMIGLLAEFPKLAVLYYTYKRKRLIKQFKAAVKRGKRIKMKALEPKREAPGFAPERAAPTPNFV